MQTHAQALDTMFVQTGQPIAGSITSPPEALAWVYAPVSREGELRYVLGAGIEPQAFQELLMAVRWNRALPRPSSIGKARSSRAPSASEHGSAHRPPEFVRQAIRDGDSGLYRGTTYEGLKNYTAFHTSPWSQWSAHLAVASTAIDAPTTWSFVAAALAALGCIVTGWHAGSVDAAGYGRAAPRRGKHCVSRRKMEAVGQLTGGIAHDFNNLLTAVIGNLDLIRNKVHDNERLRRLADNALEASRRGAKLASQLLAFSRSQRMSVGPVDLQQLFNGIERPARAVGGSIGRCAHVTGSRRTPGDERCQSARAGAAQSGGECA